MPYVILLQWCAKGSVTLPPQILDELIIAGELQESSKKSVLRVVRPFSIVYPDALTSTLTHCGLQVTQADSIEEQENSEDTMARLGSLGSRGP